MSTTATAADQWVVLRGAISAETITTAVTALAERRQLQCALDEGAGTLRLTDPVTSPGGGHESAAGRADDRQRGERRCHAPPDGRDPSDTA